MSAERFAKRHVICRDTRGQNFTGNGQGGGIASVGSLRGLSAASGPSQHRGDILGRAFGIVRELGQKHLLPDREHRNQQALPIGGRVMPGVAYSIGDLEAQAIQAEGDGCLAITRGARSRRGRGACRCPRSSAVQSRLACRAPTCRCRRWPSSRPCRCGPTPGAWRWR